MSKYNNVNPDHYKVAGRERPGKVGAARNKAQSTEAEERRRWTERRKLEVRGKKVEVREEVQNEQPEEVLKPGPEAEGKKREARSR
jgi:hypothetical protein